MHSIRVRRGRAWATRDDELHLLGRSARQTAMASAGKLRNRETVSRLSQFVKLTVIEHACKLMRADLLVRLIDDDGLRPIDIARKTGLRPSDLSEMYATAKMFPLRIRPDGIPYNILLLATRMVRRFRELGIEPTAALAEICRQRLSQHRDVSRHFSQLARAATFTRVSPASRTAGDSVVDSTYHCRFQELLDRIPDRSAKIIHVDPPYVYRNTTRGEYKSRSSRSRACDNGSKFASVEICIDLLREWKVKLAIGGVVLLCQASGPLHGKILDAIDEFDWHLTGPIIWDKGRPQPGDFGAPYSRQTEMLWVLSRPGDDLVNHDGSSRSDILRFQPVSFPGVAKEQIHCFEKPLSLCKFLVSKHSRPGDLVLDLCGCSASMSLAAIDAGRHWIYVESNSDNYRIGVERIARRPTIVGRATAHHFASVVVTALTYCRL